MIRKNEKYAFYNCNFLYNQLPTVTIQGPWEGQSSSVIIFIAPAPLGSYNALEKGELIIVINTANKRIIIGPAEKNI